MPVWGYKFSGVSREEMNRFVPLLEQEGFQGGESSPDGWLIILNPSETRLQDFPSVPSRTIHLTSEPVDLPYVTRLRPQADETDIRQILRLLNRDLSLDFEFRRMTEDLLSSKKLEGKFRKTLQATPDAIVIVDQDGRITFVNDQALDLFGYKTEELIGERMELLMPAEMRDQHPAHRGQFMKSPRVRPMGSGLDLWCQKKNGSQFPVEISLSPVMTETGLQVASAIRDITTRKNSEAELKRARDDAESANRAKSEFLANMSHELRTPLNAILGYCQILEKDKTLVPQQREGLEIIRRSGEHLLTLINDILDLSKIESGHMELHRHDFDFTDFLDAIAEITRMKSKEKGINFIFERLSDLPPAIHSDEKKLRQILFNLLSNAVKFTDEGGVAFKVGYHEGKIRFQIEDTGIGIASDKIRELFLPFHQVGDKFRHVEGTGLGLAISQRLARMLASEINVKSQPGEGSTFWFEADLIPVEDFQAAPKVNERMVVGYEGPRKKILIVDDKWENRSVLVKMLSPLGFDILESKDGFDCLNKVVTFKPDLILLDLRMPEMDGLEVARRVRSARKKSETVIIAVSASVFEHNREDSVRSGCDDFIAKPFQMSRILGLLQNHLDISWIYEADVPESSDPSGTPDPNSFVPVPEEFAYPMYQAAMMGDVEELLLLADRIENGTAAHKMIPKTIRKWVKSFELGKIIKMAEEKGYHYDN